MLPDLGPVQYILIDGSFVEDHPEPRDIDVVFVVDTMVDQSPGGTLLGWVRRRHESIRAIHGCDVYVSDEIDVSGYWIRQFGFTRAGTAKGILKVTSGWGGGL
ncbi:MAG: hypothetical protein L3J95_05090 [Thermoplasmata archaeon]|nr:hypothetical protein [Thermoplasmata archaeon]